MTRPWGISLFLLTILVVLVTSMEPGKNEVNLLESFILINASNANVRQCVWYAMQEYNEESKDKYVFLVTKILKAQLQITDRMEYFIEVDIARSSCRKPLTNNENCVILENSKLEKRITCSFLVAALPWNGDFTLMKRQCEDE